jgi:hypothetical protein
MKALALALGLVLITGPVLAAEPDEDMLYHWGECAVVGGMYEAAIERGSGDPRILSTKTDFDSLTPQMEAHANDLATRLGEERASAVRERLFADYEGHMTGWVSSDDPEGFLVATLGKTMDRCLKEAAVLPVPGRPVT